ncbi:MAG: glycoside hydrolase [Prevotella sp.]|nr:glycoside hydrolase [Prevotella sp.]
MKKSFILSLALAATALTQAQIPLVYDVENTGSRFPQPKMPAAEKLPIVKELPDALEGVGSFADWSRRRSDIGHMIQHYGIGTKPAVKPRQVKARMEGDTALVVDVTVGRETLTLRSVIRYPKVGRPPYALMIGTDMIALPRQLFANRPIATMTFSSAQVNDYKQFGPHHDRGEHNFDRLYPKLTKNGAYSEWAWGMSRLIDGLQQLGPEVTKIDTRRIGVTGCSYAGKMALYCGAFDERIALTIAQEPGGGGAAAWRVSHQSKQNLENLDKTDYHWFLESQRENFHGDSVYRLPYDQHELCAMVCPRALLLLGNPDFVWLADSSMAVSAQAARKVWERFGIADRFGCDIIGGHGHCRLPEVQYPLVQAYIDRFLLDGQPWTRGGFDTRRYRNLFAETGHSREEVDRKLEQVYNDVFHGPNKVYFEVGDSMAYISDIKNHDARTEGMSYGMMIAVQLDKKDVFDRLWRWSKKYMQHQDGPRQGYFAWSCKTDGTRNAQGAASDGELYFITSLIFASNRWGDSTGINYKAEAQHILNAIQPREVPADNAAPAFGPQQNGPRRMYLIDPETHLITFTPDGFGQRFTDPSYHIPAFYEVWARWADDGRSDYWRLCAEKSREFLHKCIDATTGLNPDMCQYDGQLMQAPAFPGRPQQQGAPRRNGSNNFRYDSWRVPMNIALDYEWSCADSDWQQQYGEKIQNFLYSQGIDTFVDQYRVDGTLPEGNEILQAGGFRKLRHSIGLVATSAAASVMCSHEKKREFIENLWNARHEPFDDGYFDAYYDGLLRLFAFMHLSGNYQVIFPNNP